MNKYIRIGGLVFFFAAAFILVILLIRMKQDYVSEWEKPVIGGLVRAPTSAGEATPDVGENDADPATEEALQAGRSMFDTPSPISAQEISDLMNRLEDRQKELDTRESALDRKQLQLSNMIDDLERNRANVMSMAKAIDAEGLLSGASSDPEQELPAIETGNLSKLAKLMEQMSPQKAADVLQAKAPEHSAAILLKMDAKKAGAIVEGFTPEHLKAVTDALLTHDTSADNGDS